MRRINKILRRHIENMAQRDQRMRIGGTWNKNVDIENTKKLRAIINKYGWPDANLVGVEASHLAWLIAQHSDHDIKFQKNV